MLGSEPPFVIRVSAASGRLRARRSAVAPLLPVCRLTRGQGAVALAPVESVIASVAPAAPSSAPKGMAGRKLRPALPSH